MAFELRKVYRPLNAHEMHTGARDALGIIPKRVQHVMQLDSTQNMARAYPLLRYEVRVTLTPYQAAGAGEPKPEKGIVYECDGEVFLPVIDQAVELVEESPIYGRSEDPQSLRTLAEQGTVETYRTATGELVDVRTKPGSRTEPAVEPPAVVISEAQSWPDGKSPAAVISTPEGARASYTVESPEETERVEAQRWQQSKTDEAVDLATEKRDPTLAPGRVSIVKSVLQGGGQDHGHRKNK